MQIKKPLSSSELATLWMTYQEKTMTQRILEYLIEKADDDKTRDILTSSHQKIVDIVDKLKLLFTNEGAVIPVGYSEQDVNKDVPKLFDNMFDIMFLRTLVVIGMGLHTLHLSMSYRKDIVQLYKELTGINQNIFDECVEYLQDNRVLSPPPSVTMPKAVEFAESTNYMSGFNIFSDKRALNTVEVSYLYFAIETNVFGMQMMTGFAQVACEDEVKKYFIKGKELSKKIVTEYSKILLQSDIQPPATWGAKATTSKVSPFSDKLMMYCTSLFSNFGLGSNAIGTTFSLRSDLPMTMISTAKDILTFGQDGGKIMAKNGWLEQPPNMEDRNQLTK